MRHCHGNSKCVLVFPPPPPYSVCLSRLMSELGYREIADTQSRAASAMTLDSPSPCPPEEAGPTEAELRAEVEKESQERLETLSLQHMEELRQLQLQYE